MRASRGGECAAPKQDLGRTRAIRVCDLQPGASHAYFLDVAASSFEDERVKTVMGGARTIFVNAVMGFRVGRISARGRRRSITPSRRIRTRGNTLRRGYDSRV